MSVASHGDYLHCPHFPYLIAAQAKPSGFLPAGITLSWFKKSPIGGLLNVTLPHSGHLYWPELDIDLAVDSIEQPERYPLMSKVE